MQVAHALFVAGRLDEAADMTDKCLAQHRERGQGVVAQVEFESRS